MAEIIDVYEGFDSCEICGNWSNKVYQIRLPQEKSFHDKFVWVCYGCYNTQSEKIEELKKE